MVGTDTKGVRQKDTQICVIDINLISASRLPSALTNAFQVACTRAAPNTIKKTSIAISEIRLQRYVDANTNQTHPTSQRHRQIEGLSQVAPTSAPAARCIAPRNGICSHRRVRALCECWLADKGVWCDQPAPRRRPRAA